MREFEFVSKAAQKEIRSLDKVVRVNLAFGLRCLQKGDEPPDFKSMSTIGPGVYELRVDDDQGNNVGRCFYVTKFENKVYVLYSFIKKDRTTSEKDKKMGRKRYAELMKKIGSRKGDEQQNQK